MYKSFAKDLKHLLPAEMKRVRPQQSVLTGKRQRVTYSSADTTASSSADTTASSSSVTPLRIMGDLENGKIESEIRTKRGELNSSVQAVMEAYSEHFQNTGSYFNSSKLDNAVRYTYWNNFTQPPTANASFKVIGNIAYITTSLKYNHKSVQDENAKWITKAGRRQPLFAWRTPDTDTDDLKAGMLAVIIERGTRTTTMGDNTEIKRTRWSNRKGVYYIDRKSKDDPHHFSGKEAIFLKPLSIRTPRKERHALPPKVNTAAEKLRQVTHYLSDNERSVIEKRYDINNDLDDHIAQISFAVSEWQHRDGSAKMVENLLADFTSYTMGLYWNHKSETPIGSTSFSVRNKEYVNDHAAFGDKYKTPTPSTFFWRRSTFGYVLAHDKNKRGKCQWFDNKNTLHWYLPANGAHSLEPGMIVGVIEKSTSSPVKHVLRGLYCTLYRSYVRLKPNKTNGGASAAGNGLKTPIYVLKRLNGKFNFDEYIFGDIRQNEINRAGRKQIEKASKERAANELFGNDSD